MASNNQLRARVRDSYLEAIRDLAEERDISESDAERAVVKHGLTRLGYLDEPTDPASLLLKYARRAGSVLGFSGLILIGWGLFGLASFRYIGFGLVTAGFALIAGAEFGPAIKSRLATDADSDGDIAS